MRLINSCLRRTTERAGVAGFPDGTYIRGMNDTSEKLDRITEDGIRQLVDAFYVKVRADAELAPIFARAIPGDWQPHLTKMYAFWSSVMLTTGRYKAGPFQRHLL